MKAPAFQFYVGDYMQDTRMVSLAARGAWMDLLCAMWRADIRGQITSSMVGYARLFGCSVEEAQAAIDEIIDAQVCDSVTERDGKMTLTNRRMYRESKERDSANLRQKRYRERERRESNAPVEPQRNGHSDAKVTPPSSSSSSSSSSTSKKEQSIVVPAAPVTTAEEKVSVSRTAQAVEIFNYWKTERGRSNQTIFDSKRKRAVDARLKDGYTVEFLKQSIRGIKNSAHHMGQNDKQQTYDDLELICRDAKNVETFAALDVSKITARGSPAADAPCGYCLGKGFSMVYKPDLDEDVKTVCFMCKGAKVKAS